MNGVSNGPKHLQNSSRLRPEAQPFSWKQLDTQQQAAAVRVMEFLQAAVEQADLHIGQMHTFPGDILDTSRFNRVLTISGERGTGKTSVLLSVRKMFRDLVRGDSKPEDPNPAAEMAQGLHTNVRWLETLDLEPLPNPTNLLVAILVRIIDLVEDIAGAPGASLPSMRDMGRAGSQAILELRRLISDVALTWDGNLQARQAALDLDAFAVETQRVEETRLRLNERLDRILNSLVKELNLGAKTVFVLPVDDFDMNPTRCLDLLRLLRMASVPRLFSVILGDRKIAEQVLSLKLAGELLGLAGRAVRDDLLPTPAKELSSTIRGVASDAIRKLLPPNHMVELRTRSIRDSLKFSPSPRLGDLQQQSLEELLEKIVFRFEDAKDAPSASLTNYLEPKDKENAGNKDSSSANLFVFFKAKHPLFQPDPDPSPNTTLRQKTTASSPEKMEGRIDLGDPPYQGLQLFRSPVRRIVDLYFTLRGLGQEIENLTGRVEKDHEELSAKERKELLQALQTSKVMDYWADVVVRRALDADASITTNERTQWTDALEKDYEDHWYLDTNPINVVYRSGYESVVGVSWQDLLKEPPSTSKNSTESRKPPKSTRKSRSEKQSIPAVELQLLSVTICTHVLKGRRLMLKDPQSHELGHRAAAALEILHDLLQLSPDRNIAGPPLTIANEQWAQTLWTQRHNPDSKMALAWPLVEWQTFWHFDLFLSCWNHYRSWALGANPEVQHERLLYGWISSATTLLMGQSKGIGLPRNPQEFHRKPEWEPLIDLLRDLIQNVQGSNSNGNTLDQSGTWRQRAIDWVAKVLLLMSPEMGTPKELRDLIIGGLSLSDASVLNQVRLLRAGALGSVAAALFHEPYQSDEIDLDQVKTNMDLLFEVGLTKKPGKLGSLWTWNDTIKLSQHALRFEVSFLRGVDSLSED